MAATAKATAILKYDKAPTIGEEYAGSQKLLKLANHINKHKMLIIHANCSPNVLIFLPNGVSLSSPRESTIPF